MDKEIDMLMSKYNHLVDVTRIKRCFISRKKVMY